MPHHQAHFLKRIQDVHAFIAANPGCSFSEIEKGLQLKSAAVRYSVNSLKDSGHIDAEDGIRFQGGTTPKKYTVLKAEKPDVIPETSTARAKRIAEEDEQCYVKRKFTKAAPMGMKPDPFALPAAFFGAAGQVSA